MRTIKVKPGSSRYRLVSDDGDSLGFFKILYSKNDKALKIHEIERGFDLDELSISGGTD